MNIIGYRNTVYCTVYLNNTCRLIDSNQCTPKLSCTAPFDLLYNSLSIEFNFIVNFIDAIIPPPTSLPKPVIYTGLFRAVVATINAHVTVLKYVGGGRHICKPFPVQSIQNTRHPLGYFPLKASPIALRRRLCSPCICFVLLICTLPALFACSVLTFTLCNLA